MLTPMVFKIVRCLAVEKITITIYLPIYGIHSLAVLNYRSITSAGNNGYSHSLAVYEQAVMINLRIYCVYCSAVSKLRLAVCVPHYVQYDYFRKHGMCSLAASKYRIPNCIQPCCLAF
jgi:hypothetical protein